MKYYVIERERITKRSEVIEFQVIQVAHDKHPMHGYGSWKLTAGPYDTYIKALRELERQDYQRQG